MLKLVEEPSVREVGRILVDEHGVRYAPTP